MLADKFLILVGGFFAPLGNASGPPASGEFGTDLQLYLRPAFHKQILKIRVNRDKLDPQQAAFNHTVYRVAAAAAGPNNLDHRGRRHKRPLVVYYYVHIPLLFALSYRINTDALPFKKILF
jgi:hypothetical protein